MPIKKSLKISLITIAILLAIPIFALILLQFNSVQQGIVNKITSTLETKLDTKVSISKARFKLFNTVNLEDVYIEDLEGDTLLYSEHLNAKLDFFKLFSNKVIIYGAVIDNLYANIKTDTEGKTNFEFIIQAFKKPDAEPAAITLELKKLSILNSRLAYSNISKAGNAKSNGFDANNILISNLNSEISIDILNTDSLSAKIKSLAFSEKSGFTLKNLSSKINTSGKNITLDFLNVNLANSALKINNITAQFDSLPLSATIFENTDISLEIAQSELYLKDIACFYPDFKGFTKPINVQGKIAGTLSNLKIHNFIASYGNSLRFSADCDLTGLPTIAETFVYAKINEIHAEKADIQDIIAMLQQKPFTLPNEIDRLGAMIFKGNISGFFSNLVAFGNITTAVGNMQTDLLVKLENNFTDIQYSGSLKSTNIRLDKLLNSNDLGDISFTLATKGEKTAKQPFKGNIDATIQQFSFKKYDYNNILINGNFDGTGFNGDISLTDDNIIFDFSGLVDMTQELPTLDFDINVDALNLNALKIINVYPDSYLSFVGKISMTGDSPENLNGFLNLKDIVFKTSGKTFNASDLNFSSKTQQNLSDYRINSKYINGSVQGNFHFDDLKDIANEYVQYYLPALSKLPKQQKTKDSNIAINLQLSKLDELANFFEIPYKIDGDIVIKGNLESDKHNVNISATIPSLVSGKTKLDNISLNLLNTNDKLSFTSRAQTTAVKAGLLNFYLTANAQNDSLNARFGWQNTLQITNAGEISTNAKIRKTDEGLLTAQLELQPSKIIISDTIWKIDRCKIDYRADSSLNINHFRLGNQTQYISANGTVSKNTNDNLFVALNQIDLEYIFRLLGMSDFMVGGIATGNADLRGLLHEPVIEAEIDVKNVTLNGKQISDAHVSSTWDNNLKKILLGGKFFTDNNDTICVATGYYAQKSDSLDIVFDTDGISLSFLNKYFEGVASNVDGRAYGAFHLFGPTKAIVFGGDIYVDNAKVTIDVLQTTYSFSD
ncbi:MAG: hypothetical protein LBV75_06770, partial [Paludibacter sp.]|nr:hypothetical protein [Paludibacter sp.]